MTALVLAPLEKDSLKLLESRVHVRYEPWTETRRLWDPRELAMRIRGENAGIVLIEADFLFDEAFEAGTPLRFVGVCRAAVNHVDVEAATERGVLVVNTPARNAQAVAEHAFGLILALARRIPEAHVYVASGRWSDPVEPYLTMRGVELAGKTLGVVGLGSIGRKVAALGRAFSMKVVGCDPYTAPRGVRMTSLEQLLESSDVVTLHASEPLDGAPPLDRKHLRMMRPSAYLINTAAAGLVDSTALAAVLREGRLGGAAIDVFESAPLPMTSPLLSAPNLVLTPHVGGATDGTIARYSASMVEDIFAFLDGKIPRRAVNATRSGRGKG